MRLENDSWRRRDHESTVGGRSPDQSADGSISDADGEMRDQIPCPEEVFNVREGSGARIALVVVIRDRSEVCDHDCDSREYGNCPPAGGGCTANKRRSSEAEKKQVHQVVLEQRRQSADQVVEGSILGLGVVDQWAVAQDIWAKAEIL